MKTFIPRQDVSQAFAEVARVEMRRGEEMSLPMFVLCKSQCIHVACTLGNCPCPHPQPTDLGGLVKLIALGKSIWAGEGSVLSSNLSKILEDSANLGVGNN